MSEERALYSQITHSDVERIGISSNHGLVQYAAKDKELELKLEKQRQDHLVVVQEKNAEVRVKDKEIARLSDKVAELESIKDATIARNEKLEAKVNAFQKDGDRNAELQTEVCDLSERLNSFSTLDRDYEAAINKITRLAAERDTLREDREKYFDLTRRLQEQVDEITQKLDHEREKNLVNQAVIRNLGHENQILKDEREEWKDRYRRQKLNKAEDGKNTQKQTWRYVVVNEASKENDEDNVSADDESFKRQSNMVVVNRGKRPIGEDHYDQSQNQSASSSATKRDGQPRPRKKKFHMAPSNVPICKNCETVFYDKNLMATECRFHRVQPQSYEVWTKLNNQETVRVNPRLKGHLFWPCCESHGKYRTKGCMSLRHHEIIYPDL